MKFQGEITVNGQTKKIEGSLVLAPILVGLDQLKGFRGGTPRNEELEWEIRLYEWILAQPDAEAKAIQYGQTRIERSDGPLDKRTVVKKLGWDIP